MASTTATQDSGLRATWRGVPGSAKAGLTLGVLGFFVRVTVEQERFVNGEPVCEYFDFGAWIIGLVTIVTGIVTVVEARRASRRGLVLGLGLLIIGLGVFHVMRAYGVFFSPC
jgi:uncharacterized membrane-anchored protein